jgi:hypothetical protein
MKRILSVGIFLCISIFGMFAKILEPANIKGCIPDKSTGSPIQFANIIVRNKKDSIYAQSVTDKNCLSD